MNNNSGFSYELEGLSKENKGVSPQSSGAGTSFTINAILYEQRMGVHDSRLKTVEVCGEEYSILPEQAAFLEEILDYVFDITIDPVGNIISLDTDAPDLDGINVLHKLNYLLARDAKSLDVSGNPELTQLLADRVTSLDVSGNPKLREFSAASLITGIPLSHFKTDMKLYLRSLRNSVEIGDHTQHGSLLEYIGGEIRAITA